jgi:type IX secretion system PorP/SprF family membrane protein
MRKLLLLSVVGLLLGVNYLGAQVDAHFTQYYAYPLWLNPAFTGVIDGDWRVTANYRRQLPGITSPIITQGVSGDVTLPKNFGLGLTVLSQVTSDGSYHYTNGYLSASYQVHLTQYQVLMGGFQLGMLNRRVDPGKLQFGNQFNPVIGYDPSLPSNEIFTHQSATSLDGSMGLMYFDGTPTKSFNPFIGVSLYHPTQPNSRFLSGAGDNKVPIRYSIHGGIRFQLSARAALIPHAVYLNQGNANEIAAGVVCNLTIQDDKELILGSTYRLNDAIAPNIGLHFNGLTIGFSYDINISQLKTASTSNGGYELSISFTHQKKTPDTRFICPRL